MLREIDFAAIEKKIENAYQAGGHQLGWRMFSCTRSAVENGRVAFISMNPGGSVNPADHPTLCVERGNAYLDEKWGEYASGAAPLQKQVRILFEKLRVPVEGIVSGHFVPFRSTSWDSLNNKEDAIKIGSWVWKEILAAHPFDLIITMGGDIWDELKNILDVRGGEKISVEWDKVAGERASYKNGVLIGLPYLGQYKIMGREKSEEALTKLFEGFF